MLDLELATTEQILDELARRPIRFVFVSMYPQGMRHLSGYLAHSPHMEPDDALSMLRQAEEFLEKPADEESFESFDDEGPLG